MSAPKHTAGVDTTGSVQCPAPDQKPNESTGCWFWSDLSPFTQGYIEALLMAANADTRLLGRVYKDLGFSDLAPETLARIIADCEGPVHFSDANERAAGRNFWNRRQAGGSPFPPLTVQLGDDGKVRFARATGEAA